MVATFLWLLQAVGLPASTDTLGPGVPAAPDSMPSMVVAPAAPDSGSTAAAPAARDSARRIVREFPAVEVRALLYDLRASETVHEIPAAAMRAYPVDRLVDLVALKPGVVAQGDEIHVRGGRAGETLTILDGVSLGEPLRQRPMELPLLALRSADLVSGTPETRYAGSLAGVLDLHTIDPGERLAGEVRWQSTAGLGTHFDRVSARVSSPIAPLGLGVVAATDITLDDTSFPALRTDTGVPYGWRAEDRLLGYLKLVPTGSPGRFSVQALGSRAVHQPYDHAWTLDGWTGYNPLTGQPVFSDSMIPGFDRYIAADHQAVTDDRRLAAIATASAIRDAGRGTVTFGWLGTRTATTVGGVHAIPELPDPARFDPDPNGDPFHVVGGDDPLFRVSGSDVYTLRADAELTNRRLTPLRVGLGGTWTRVWLDEIDATLENSRLDSLRSYRASAPWAFAYGQGRWQSGGLVVNAGLRAEYFTPGEEGAHQTLPDSGSGHWSLLPRIGIAYPISSRDVISTAYARIDQDPARDLLYDHRTKISNRQPLGNPALRPATMISYELALKHLFSVTWAVQAAFFYRDAAHMAGARNYQTPGGPVDPRYTDEDQASSSGLEVSVVHARDDAHRFEAHYTIMRAWGYESRPEGDPYGPLLAPGIPPIGEQPLSWDRRHSVLVSGLWTWRERVTLGWSSTVGSPLPWTPKPRRQSLTDVTTVNSRRLGWSETTNLSLGWSPPYALGLTFGLEARNLFDNRSEVAATVDGYPNPFINTLYDDYGAYRTETGLSGGAYWSVAGGTPHWVPVHDPRLIATPRTVRASIARRW
jgi:hypothetical protein